jgi:hypothetical protein
MATPAQRARRRRARARRASNKKQAPPVNQKRSNRSKGSGGSSSALVNQVISFANPWSLAGAQKYHDGNNAKTIPYRLRDFHTITLGEDSAVSGYYRGGYMVLPRVYVPFYKPTYTATNQLPITDWAVTGSVYSEYSDLVGVTKSYRITSWGVRVYSIGPPLTSAGIVVVRTITADDPTADYEGPNARAEDRFEQAISPGMDFYWQSKPTDINSRNFSLVDSSAAAELDNWTIPQIFVEAASATTSIRIEVVFNIELTAASGDLFARMVTMAPERNEGFMDGVNRLYKYLPNIMPNADHGVGPAVLRGATALATKLITRGVNNLMSGPVRDDNQLLLEY